MDFAAFVRKGRKHGLSLAFSHDPDQRTSKHTFEHKCLCSFLEGGDRGADKTFLVFPAAAICLSFIILARQIPFEI